MSQVNNLQLDFMRKSIENLENSNRMQPLQIAAIFLSSLIVSRGNLEISVDEIEQAKTLANTLLTKVE